MNPETNQALTVQEQVIVIISALTATGDLDNLKIQLNSALDARLTINEIKEAFVHLYGYCGFPGSLKAFNTFKTILDERKNKRYCRCGRKNNRCGKQRSR